MTSLFQKINELNVRVDNVSTSGGGGTTDTTSLQAQVNTNTTDISGIQINKQDTLTAGDNITITGNTISSSGGGGTTVVSDKIFFASRSADTSELSATSFYSSFDTLRKINSEIYSYNNSDTVTVLKSGAYKIEFISTFYNSGYTDRGSLGSIVSVNGSIDRGLGGLATTYIRHQDYGRHGSTSNAVYRDLIANDTIRIFNGINKASELGFSSSMSGYKFVAGSNLMITYLD